MAEFKLSIDAGDGQLVPIIVEAPTLEEAGAKAAAQRDVILRSVAASAVAPPASFADRFAGEPPPPPTDILAPQAKRELEAGLVKQAEELGRPTPVQSAAIGAGQAAGLGWLDEITGVLGGTFDKRPDESWSDAYERHRQSAQRGIASSQAINPKSHLAGQVGGVAAGIPIGAASRAGAMATGAITGALAGAGEGETVDERAKNAAIGTLVGTAGGAVAPEIGRVIGAGVDLAKRGLGRVGSALGINAPGKLTQALREAGVDEATAQRMIAEASEAGQDLTLGDVGKTSTGRLAREAANLSPAAQSQLQSVTGPRASIDERVSRIRNFIDNLGTRSETAATRDALAAEARAANQANYLAAYEKHPTGVVTPDLERLSASPAIKDAMARTIKEGVDDAITEGITPPRDPTSLQFWDYTRRNLRTEAINAKGDRQRVLFKLHDQLRAALDEAAPSYRTTRNAAAEFFGHDNALDAGRDLLNTGLNAEAAQRARAAVQKMSKPDRALLEAGFLDEAYHRVGKPTSGEPARGVFGSVNQRQAAEVVLGKERAARLEKFLEAERLMTAFHGQVAGGSSTARQATDLLRQYGGTAGLGAAVGAGQSLARGEDDWATTGTAAAGGLVAGAVLAGSRGAQAKRLAELMTSSDPRVQKRVLQALTISPGLRQLAEQLVAQGAGRLGVAGGGASP